MYTCMGDICGSCDIRHRKLSAAFRCLHRLMDEAEAERKGWLW